jgi:hypothetical protein
VTRKTPKNLTFSEELLCTLPARRCQAWARLGRLVGLGRVAGWLLTALINKDIFTSSLKDDDGDGASKKTRGVFTNIYFSSFKVFRYPNATQLGDFVDLNFLEQILQNICQKTM